MFYSKKLKKIGDIEHCFFSRKNGTSKGIYQSLNCGIGSRDESSRVKNNLELVAKKLKISKDELVLMNQTHSNQVEFIENKNNLKRVKSDAILTKNKSIALGVLTADCAPILIYEIEKEIIGSIHAGWKGALNGIIENTIKKIQDLGGSSKKLLACVGPCIAQNSYEVKEDFYLMFTKETKKNESFFSKNQKKTFNFDLRGFVNKKLKNCGVLEIDNINLDSYASKNEYFSHRRAKKLGENDYGRCISVIKKLSKKNN